VSVLLDPQLYQPRTYTLEGIADPDNSAFETRNRRHGPRIRFWATDAEGNGLRMVEGTLDVRTINVKQTGSITEYTIDGNLWPPIYQYLIPDEIEHEMQPVAPLLEDDDVLSEIDFEGAGFHPLGYISDQGLNIETTTEVQGGWGRAYKTRQETTVKFTTCDVNRDVMDRLWKR
jgi:hypothetical protein